MKTPFFLSPQTDANIHHLWALDILRFGVFRDTAFYQSPFYPYLLALFYKLFGVHPLLISILQVLLDSATCVIIYMIADRLFDKKAAACAGIIAALYAPFIFFSTPLLKEVWTVFCLAVFIRLLIETETKDKLSIVLWTGLALGFCALSRGQTLLFAPVICAYWLFVKKNRRIRKYLIFGLGVCLPLFPVTLHNYVVSHDFVLINYTSGFSFFIGNNPQSEIWTQHPLGVSSSPFVEERQVTQMAERLSGRKLKPSQVSAFWHRQSLHFITTHPLNWLTLTVRKFIFFWNRVDIPDNYSIDFFRRHFTTILNLPLFSFAVVAALGIAGMALCRGRSREIDLIIMLGFIYMATVVFCVLSTRYRLPMAFFLILFAGAAIVEFVNKPKWRRLIVAVPFWIFILLPPPFDKDLLEIKGAAQLVMVYYDAGEFEKSTRALEKALIRDSSVMAPVVYLRGAVAYEKIKDPDNADRIYRQGIKANPDNFVMSMEYGIFLYNQDKIEAAIEQFERAYQLQPDAFAVCKNLALAYLRQEEYAKAVACARKALQINPHDEELKKIISGF